MKNKLPSIRNMRDLGDIKDDKVRIKKGLIFRSANLGKISEEDLVKFNKLKIDLIIDLRRHCEIKEHPDVVTNSENKNAPFNRKNSNQKAPSADQLKVATKEFYENFIKVFSTNYTHIRNNEAIKEVIKTMNDHKSFLFHCAGGKDRTGVIAYIFEQALGMSEETATKDYLRTNQYRKKERDFVNMICEKEGITGWGKKVFMTGYANADKNLIAKTRKAIFGKYGSIENYLNKEYQVTREQIEDWKDCYLVKVED